MNSYLDTHKDLYTRLSVMIDQSNCPAMPTHFIKVSNFLIAALVQK